MDHYETLGVPNNASTDDIKKAYRKLAMKHHPDKPGGDPELFKKINQAHETLSNPERRAHYDQFGSDEPNAGGGGPMNNMADIFAQMFGQGQRKMKRQDHHHVIELSFDEVYHGVTKTIKITVNKPCFACLQTCAQCHGQGMVTAVQNMGFMSQMFQQPCPSCQASGSLPSGCSKCAQKKHTNQTINLNITIQSGIEDGSTRHIEDFGEQARTPNEKSGDLVIIFRIKKHPLFERNGTNLRYKELISLEDSIAGKTFTVPHFLGDFRISTHEFAPVIDPRKEYRVTGKGLTKDSDLYIHFDVQYPSDMSLRYQLTPVDYVVVQTPTLQEPSQTQSQSLRSHSH